MKIRDCESLDEILLELDLRDIVRNDNPEICQAIFEEALYRRKVVCQQCGKERSAMDFTVSHRGLIHSDSIRNTCNVCMQKRANRR